jgi:peroxiredoxin Q/BCP
MIFVVGAAFLALASTAACADPSSLTIGDKAPMFELPGSDGSTYRLADFRGKQVVVLAWFPKAFTGG